MNKKLLVLLLLLISYNSKSVRGEKFDLEVYASKFDSIPIGIIDFKQKGKEALTENLPADIIASDLDFCGRFIVVKKTTFDSAAFVGIGAGIYIDGEYEIIGQKIIIECFLKDVLTKELIVSKKYKGELKFIVVS
ncbi:MAG: hypothetical protein N2053_09110 [Chitinispirillaceae bacterium]|nr:hypothetical protein [Chitinispirillaceae bacterium]